MRPGRARDRQERAALLAQFERHLRRAAPCRGALGDGVEGRPVLSVGAARQAAANSAPSTAPVPCSSTLSKPGHQRGAVLDEAFLDRGLDAVAVAEGADRIGGRQPGQQAIERLSHGGLHGQMARALAGIVIVLAVGAAFRIERRAHLADHGAQALQHVDDDVVVADQDAVGVDLRPADGDCRDARRGARTMPRRGRAPRPGPPRRPSPRRSRPPPASGRRRYAARWARRDRAGNRARHRPACEGGGDSGRRTAG